MIKQLIRGWGEFPSWGPGSRLGAKTLELLEVLEFLSFWDFLEISVRRPWEPAGGKTLLQTPQEKSEQFYCCRQVNSIAIWPPQRT